MKIMVSAGEVSGDLHGAYLITELKKLLPQAHFFGMGSEKLAAAGVDIKIDISRHGTIGIIEALPNFFPVYFAFRQLVGFLRSEKPDLLLLIDSQGINLPLARAAKKLGIKTAYYIAPQEWLWGTPKGVKRVANSVDLIVAIFEKEFQAYRSAGANVVYFGHPLIDIVKPSLSRDEARLKLCGLPVGDQTSLICLCPGSRTREIKGLLPILLQAAELIRKDLPTARFLIPAASSEISKLIRSTIEHCASKIDDYRLVEGQTYNALNAADLALCTSGTINLEASILGRPNIMVYKLSNLTYLVGKYILKIDQKIKYFSMPNILLDRPVIPELVMSKANSGSIAATTLALLADPARCQSMGRSFSRLVSLLGQPGVITRVANSIIS